MPGGLGDVDMNVDPMLDVKEKGKEKEKVWQDGGDFAYEYVPVVQVSLGWVRWRWVIS
jgi:hypothetical protein